MQEYKEVLHRRKFSSPKETLHKWEAILDRDTHLSPVSAELEFPRDRKDARLLACAITNDVDFFITGDGDFEEAHKIINTTIVSVSMFLRLISGEE